jgi:hypothetical protein
MRQRIPAEITCIRPPGRSDQAFGSGLQYCNSRIGWFLETTVVEIPLLDREIKQRFRAIEGSGVSKASARVREQMTSDKKQSNFVNQIISSD